MTIIITFTNQVSTETENSGSQKKSLIMLGVCKKKHPNFNQLLFPHYFSSIHLAILSEEYKLTHQFISFNILLRYYHSYFHQKANYLIIIKANQIPLQC